MVPRWREANLHSAAPHREQRLTVMNARLALAWLIAGCAVPTMHDLDGRPVAHPARVGYGEGFWLVVDTSASRERVLLEVLVETDRQASRPGRVLLGLGTGGILTPRAVRGEEPSCRHHRVTAENGRRSGDHEPPSPGVFMGPDWCLWVVRAEFALSRPLPDTITVVVDFEHRRVAWARDEPAVLPIVRH